jgi:hypothetical protein
MASDRSSSQHGADGPSLRARPPSRRPLDDDLVQAPLNQWQMPVDVIGLPVPVLDDKRERQVGLSTFARGGRGWRVRRLGRFGTRIA